MAASLISAQTERGARLAMSAMEGDFAQQVQQATAGIDAVRMEVEAGIDFAEEELSDFNVDAEQLESLAQSLQQLNALSLRGHVSRRMFAGFKLAIIGPPNSGKSSLINYLCQKNISIISDMAGTTRDLVTRQIDLFGVVVEIVDTAGIRQQPTDAVEKIGIDFSQAGR